MIKNLKKLCLLIWICTLAACSFFDTDNTPEPTKLTEIKPEITPKMKWAVNAGSGMDDDFLRISPAVTDHSVITADKKGRISSINKKSGEIEWQVNTGLPLATGPGTGENLVVVGSSKGNIHALSALNGKTLWKVEVNSEILANPVVTKDKVLVKTIDGHLYALSTRDGHTLWTYEQVEPSVILRGTSLPKTWGNYGVVGFANGNLVKLSLSKGDVAWLQPITLSQGSLTVQRMIDIDADPFLMNDRIYVATYQGKIAALDWTSGQTLWSQDISSYAGLSGEHGQIFVSDAKSVVWAFAANNGLSKWRQTQLGARNITGPAAINGYVVVGDAEGYLHWLSQKDGHFAGRIKLANAAILAPPVVDGNTLYVVNQKGYLAAYNVG